MGAWVGHGRNTVRLVYFVLATTSRRIKVGISHDPIARMHKFQTGCPEELRMLACVRGDLKLEASIHTQLAAHAVNGEWYEANAESMATIRDVVSRALDIPSPDEVEPTAVGCATYRPYLLR